MSTGGPTNYAMKGVYRGDKLGTTPALLTLVQSLIN